MESTELITTAARFVNSTQAHIFLTGKAGTGKTTFLRDIAQKTHKRYVIVAPTGIAALNAKGVTIHSQFLLPLGTFIPVRDPSGSVSDSGGFYTQNTLVRRNPLNAARKNVLRDIDLLIIDEVSMLRADVLDAIDHRLRHARRNYQVPFGGVQVLMIGDLFQLPPIVRDNERRVMNEYYRSPWFFDALVLQESGFVHIELDKIFRQQDDDFIRILNHLRNDIATAEDIEALNRHYLPQYERDNLKDIITLTTHNRRADAMNIEALNRLEGDALTFSAEIEGDFPESMYPVSEHIVLKVGARIMFIKNDTLEGRFFNGKLATVESIDSEGITVIPDGETEALEVPRMVWENRRYTVDEVSKELEEDIIGTFSHYPIKYAWAITVHKSQGLTFEKAVVDVGRAFAAGQVYVALSRLTSLEGLVLGTRIEPRVISTDREIIAFTRQREDQPPLPDLLDRGQRRFVEAVLTGSFDYSEVTDQIGRFMAKDAGKMEFEDETMRSSIARIKQLLEDERENTQKFKAQLMGLLARDDRSNLMERLSKGRDYFEKVLWECLQQLLEHAAQVRKFTRTKTYLNNVMEIDLLLMKKLHDAHQAASLSEQILQDEDIIKNERIRENLQKKRQEIIDRIEQSEGANPVKAVRKSGRKRKSTTGSKPKRKKGETYKVTLDMLNEGLEIESIAEKRGMAASTIEGHVARLIRNNQIEIDRFMPKEEVKKVAKALALSDGGGISETVASLGGDYSYGKVRMVQAVMERVTAERTT